MFSPRPAAEPSLICAGYVASRLAIAIRVSICRQLQHHVRVSLRQKRATPAQNTVPYGTDFSCIQLFISHLPVVVRKYRGEGRTQVPNMECRFGNSVGAIFKRSSCYPTQLFAQGSPPASTKAPWYSPAWSKSLEFPAGPLWLDLRDSRSPT
jgi:hypothetical protein